METKTVVYGYKGRGIVEGFIDGKRAVLISPVQNSVGKYAVTVFSPIGADTIIAGSYDSAKAWARTRLEQLINGAEAIKHIPLGVLHDSNEHPLIYGPLDDLRKLASSINCAVKAVFSAKA